MRRPRNPATMVHSLSCTDTEWERVRERADAAGLSMSRYLVERALTAELPRDGDGKIGPPPRLVLSDVVRRAILTLQYHANSIPYRADRRATHAPNNNPAMSNSAGRRFPAWNHTLG